MKKTTTLKYQCELIKTNLYHNESVELLNESIELQELREWPNSRNSNDIDGRFLISVNRFQN